MTTNSVESNGGFASRVRDLLKQVQYRRMESAEELEAVRHLRYTAYLKEGAIEPSNEERLWDPFDDIGNVVNFGVFLQEKLAGAVRIHFLDGLGQQSPAFDAFPEILEPYLAAGKRIVDPNRFVVDYDTARQYPELAYVTVRVAVLADYYFDAHLMTATVRAEHQAFYKRTFFATPACEPRPYPTLNKKISLMIIDCEKDRERIHKRNPYFAYTPEEIESMFGSRTTPSAGKRPFQSAA